VSLALLPSPLLHLRHYVCTSCRIIIDIGKQLGRKLLSGNLNLIDITLPVSCQPEQHQHVHQIS
jgi:hypothetical protein